MMRFWLTGLVLVGLLTGARADSVNVQIYHPSAFPTDLPSVSTTRISFPWQLTAGVNTHFTANPLGFAGTDVYGRKAVEETLTSRTMTDVCLSLALGSYLDLGVVQSLVVQSAGKPASAGFSGVGDLNGFTVGETRVSLKGIFWRTGVFRMGLQADATVPNAAGGEEKLASSGLGGGPKLLMDLHMGRVMVALNAGAHFRQDRVKIGEYLEAGHELTGGLGMSLRVDPQVHLLGESFFRTQLDGLFGANTTQLEWMAGVRYSPHPQFAMTLGGGSGTPLFSGYGTSQFRAYADLRWMMAELAEDHDGDGIDDGMDQCPLFPEDVDAYRDLDGCPDPDNDGDGILDTSDQCPNQAEDRDGFEDADGCPDVDNDADGIADSVDACPMEAEDKDLFEDADGCPDPDNDGDGVLDLDDMCPNKAETKNGFEDTDGCPDFSGVSVQDGKIRLIDPLTFDRGRFDVSSRAFAGLRNMARLIRQNPAWRKVQIKAHLDSQGSPSDALILSQKQANAVFQFLVTEGVSYRRLEAIGAGGSEPVASNRTRKGRTSNRRVEFLILR